MHNSSDLKSAVRSAQARRSLPVPALCRGLREAAGVSQEAVAIAVGVSRVTVTRWESGSRRPSRRYVEAYAQVLEQLAVGAGVGASQ